MGGILGGDSLFARRARERHDERGLKRGRIGRQRARAPAALGGLVGIGAGVTSARSSAETQDEARAGRNPIILRSGRRTFAAGVVAVGLFLARVGFLLPLGRFLFTGFVVGFRRVAGRGRAFG